MSVLLTAAKNSVRPKSRAKSAKKTKKRSPSPVAAGHVSKDSVKMWAFKTEGTHYDLIFRKDTGQIWINGKEVPSDDILCDFDSNGEGTVINFTIGSDKARIMGKRGGKGIDHQLTVNGYLIPE